MSQIANQNPASKYLTKNVALLIGIVWFASAFGWVLSGIIHEFGHALAVLSFGGTVTELQPFVFSGAPHVAYAGSFTVFQRAIFSAAGASTAYLVGAIVLLLVPFKRTSPGVSLGVTFGIVPFLGQSISYMILPILYLLNVSVQDDVINFLAFSQLNPMWVSLCAAVLAAIGVWIIAKRCRVISTIQAAAGLQNEGEK